jgi:hypothetical protein
VYWLRSTAPERTSSALTGTSWFLPMFRFRSSKNFMFVTL